MVEVPDRAHVLLDLVIGDAAVPLRVLGADALRVVGRRVVGDDDLEVRIVLRQQ